MSPNPMEEEEEEEESEPESSDNEEIQSHPNGRLTASSQPVTVAAPPYHQQQHHHHQTLTLALPIQNPSRAPAATSGREDCWSEGATGMLIDAWGERYLELSRGNLKQKHWKDVADIVSSRDDYTKPLKTDVQCKNRIDTVKKKYKIEKAKIASGSGPSKWVFFTKLDRLIGGPPRKPNTAAAPMPTTPTIPISVSKPAIGIPVQRPPLQQQMPGSSNSAGPDSSDSFPPVTVNGKKRRIERGSAQARAGNSVRELTRAVLEFGEVYERVERSKLQQVMEMEQQRMVFAKELELQRMQFFMKTQLELAQMKHGRTGISNNSNNTG
ncbi:trihelix transcription factor ASIL2 [Magnolia sinica]|uniref:trihelix transcription factor ASIL2 n=1 Tax=Magnolia sinica TaxID=86752 RepID=UPI00265B22C8|nr:trihelix transcription factor ASIL2 [Magnolia sinica]